MKGLGLSILVFILCTVSVMVVSQLVRVERHSKVFWGAFACWSPVYFVTYWITPENCYILHSSFLACPGWLDMTYGYVVFALNYHSLLDFFFAVNGGFSACILAEIYKAREKGLSTNEIVGMFSRQGDMDKICAWRLPRMVQTGYLRVERGGDETAAYRLTAKGRLVALGTKFGKRLLNLDRGG